MLLFRRRSVHFIRRTGGVVRRVSRAGRVTMYRQRCSRVLRARRYARRRRSERNRYCVSMCINKIKKKFSPGFRTTEPVISVIRTSRLGRNVIIIAHYMYIVHNSRR